MDIKESIELITKLLQFPELEIVISAETDGINPKANKFKGITFQSYEADSNGNYKPVYSKEAGGIPENKLEAFYNKLYIKTESENPNLKLSTFYKLELKYIQGLSASTKEEYFGVIDSMLDFLNDKINAQTVKTYKTFDELYRYAILYGSIEGCVNEIGEANQKNYYNLTFNMWLQENKGWRYGDEEHYNTLLTKDNWLMYLAYEKRNTEKVKEDYEAERATWKLPSLEQLLLGNITVEQIKKANDSHHTDLLNRLSIVTEFEEPNCVIQLFRKGNEYFKEQGKLDYNEIEEARKTNTKEVDPHRTRSLIHLDVISEAEVKELEALFQEKFKVAKEHNGYKTEARYAKFKVEGVKLRFEPYRNWFPILDQWIEFLEAKALHITLNNVDRLEQKKIRKLYNYKALAFYYYYMQCVNEVEWFDNWEGGREIAYKKVINEHFRNPAKTGWKQLQREYIKIEREHTNNRYKLCTTGNYQEVITLLKNNPKALAKAKEELSKVLE